MYIKTKEKAVQIKITSFIVNTDITGEHTNKLKVIRRTQTQTLILLIKQRIRIEEVNKTTRSKTQNHHKALLDWDSVSGEAQENSELSCSENQFERTEFCINKAFSSQTTMDARYSPRNINVKSHIYRLSSWFWCFVWTSLCCLDALGCYHVIDQLYICKQLKRWAYISSSC